MKLVGQRQIVKDDKLVEVGFRLDAPAADRLTYSAEHRTLQLGQGETKAILAGATDVTWFQVVESFDE